MSHACFKLSWLSVMLTSHLMYCVQNICVHVFFLSVFHCCILTIRFAGMGNLLKVLTREIENYPHFFLDFESKSGRRVEQREKRWMEKEMWGGGRGGVTSSAVSFLSAGLCSQWRSPEGVCLCSSLFLLCFSFHSVMTSCSFSSDLPFLPSLFK